MIFLYKYLRSLVPLKTVTHSSTKKAHAIILFIDFFNWHAVLFNLTFYLPPPPKKKKKWHPLNDESNCTYMDLNLLGGRLLRVVVYAVRYCVLSPALLILCYNICRSYYDDFFIYMFLMLLLH